MTMHHRKQKDTYMWIKQTRNIRIVILVVPLTIRTFGYLKEEEGNESLTSNEV